MKICITGATGFVGKPLCASLIHDGHELIILSRDPASARVSLDLSADYRSWDPEQALAPLNSDDAIDAIVHLAGHPVATSRWTRAMKNKIRDSRVVGTKNLVAAVKQLTTPPKIFVSASAIGFYGDRGDELLHEMSPVGSGFLPEVCRDWEDASRHHGIPGMRWAALRIGIVLARGGGALEKMLPPFRLGLGGPFGMGKRWMSWIHRDDLVALFRYVLAHETCAGIVNAVAPHVISNADFTKALAHALRRPAILPVPTPIIHLLFGEMASVLLASARVAPQAALNKGFAFRYPDITDALASLDLSAAK